MDAAPSPYRQLVRRAAARVVSRSRYLTNGPAGSSSVCLTFDDGPDPEHTPAVLDALDRLEVTATFFVVGKRAVRHPELVRRIAAAGHAVGHHSYSHADPGATSAREFLSEVRRTARELEQVIGEAPTLFRPPHGKLTVAKALALWSLGQTIVLWNVDPKDFACESSAAVSEWFALHPVQAGDIVLLHDNRPYAAEALPGLVADAKRRKLTFARVSEWTTRG